MRVTKAFLKQQVQQYVRDVFADTLREAGFTSYKNDDICWFRTINGEVAHHVYFGTKWCHTPILLDITYGFYPLYADIDIPTTPYAYDRMGDYLVDRLAVLSPNITYPGSDCLMCPNDGSYGLTVLTEKVLPAFTGMDSAQNCYSRHKALQKQGKEGLEDIFKYLPPPSLINQMIYNDDAQLYPAFLEMLDRIALELSSNPYVSAKSLNESLAKFARYRIAIEENRQPFIDELEKKKLDFIRKLQKGGIPV